MIDTVRLFCPHERLPDVPHDWDLTTYASSKVRSGGEVVERAGFTLEHRPTGLRAKGSGTTIEWVEASLPRLLYGHNGRLITCQHDIDRAMRMVSRLLKQVGEQLTALRYFTRVDLVWQFQGDPAAFMAAHRNCKHRSIRKEAGSFNHNSLWWHGSEMRVSMYDKVLEQTGKAGDVVRVEVQLRGKRLKKELAEDDGRVTSLDFDTCYRAYRRILLGFSPASLPKAGSMAQMLALAERHDWTANGVSAFDLWAREKSAKQISRVRKQMATLRPEVHQIDWEALLPVNSLPSVVEANSKAEEERMAVNMGAPKVSEPTHGQSEEE